MIEPDLTDSAILEELGHRILEFRLIKNLSQLNLAREASVGVNTVYRIERGKSIQLSSLIQILRALDQLPLLEVLVPATRTELEKRTNFNSSPEPGKRLRRRASPKPLEHCQETEENSDWDQ